MVVCSNITPVDDHLYSEDQESAINVRKQHKRCVYLYKYIYSSSH